jgi:hypothetical protein
LEEKIVYFEEPGGGNTETALRLALERARARSVRNIILASTGGDTARRAAGLLEGTGIRMTVVPHQYGFKEGAQTFPAELVAELRRRGHAVHFGTMLFHTDRSTAPGRRGPWPTCCASSARASRCAWK